MRLLNALTLFLSLALACALAGAAFAQDYPTKPIRLVVPFPPGGGADIIARNIVEPLGRRLGQPVIVDNRGGAGGTLGADLVAHAAPDGYTLLYTTPGQQMVNPHLMAKLPYDAANDLTAVSQLSLGTYVLVVHKDVPAKSVAELVAYAKAHPGKVNFASSGIGAGSHLGAELLKSMAGIQIVHVPYKGSGPAVADVIGGRVQMALDSISVYMPHIKSGALRALGVSSLARNPSLPDTPPIADAVPGFEAAVVNYISAPAGTPKPVIERLSKEINAVLKLPEVQAKFHANGTIPRGSSPEQMQALIKSESAKWKKVIEIAGVKPQ